MGRPAVWYETGGADKFAPYAGVIIVVWRVVLSFAVLSTLSSRPSMGVSNYQCCSLRNLSLVLQLRGLIIKEHAAGMDPVSETVFDAGGICCHAAYRSPATRAIIR